LAKSSPTLGGPRTATGEQRTPGNLRSPCVKQSRAPTEEKSAVWRDQQRSGCRVLLPDHQLNKRRMSFVRTFRESHEEREFLSSWRKSQSCLRTCHPARLTKHARLQWEVTCCHASFFVLPSRLGFFFCLFSVPHFSFPSPSMDLSTNNTA
jgi:hypothetical protein